jgi:phenylalanyl-tRNA synthetase alpha chain
VEESIKKIEEHALAELKSVFPGNGKPNREIVEALYTRFLGRKGEITRLLRKISELSPEKRPMAGQKVNELKKKIDDVFKKALGKIDAMAEGEDEKMDVSLPGRAPQAGSLHPVSRISGRICEIFRRLGFDIAEGPEVENDYYNFEALNFPANHPARDMQDTFFVSDNVVLRTHTSPLQVRVMEKQPPPVQVIAPGKVYRCDSDLTHTPMFHQVEGLLVGKNISFGDLKGILSAFIHQMFDDQTSLRFRPSFFPFTEPSAEVDILCVMCRGKGCRVCSRTGWLEVLGSGMVHPAVFEHVGYDASKYTGFAFGMGVERIAMLKYGIDDIRKFFENDSRFLRQF